MKIFGIVLLAIALVVGISIVGRAIRIALLPVRAIDRSITTGEGIIDKTLTADNAIYNYEWFKQTAEDIKAIETKITNADEAVAAFEAGAGSRKDWTFEDKTEHARLSSIAQGLRSQYQDVVAQYNARAKMANRNIFLDGKIPSFIEIGSQFLK